MKSAEERAWRRWIIGSFEECAREQRSIDAEVGANAFEGGGVFPTSEATDSQGGAKGPAARQAQIVAEDRR